jgi:hypothetical protein
MVEEVEESVVQGKVVRKKDKGKALMTEQDWDALDRETAEELADPEMSQKVLLDKVYLEKALQKTREERYLKSDVPGFFFQNSISGPSNPGGNTTFTKGWTHHAEPDKQHEQPPEKHQTRLPPTSRVFNQRDDGDPTLEHDDTVIPMRTKLARRHVADSNGIYFEPTDESFYAESRSRRKPSCRYTTPSRLPDPPGFVDMWCLTDEFPTRWKYTGVKIPKETPLANKAPRTNKVSHEGKDEVPRGNKNRDDPPPDPSSDDDPREKKRKDADCKKRRKKQYDDEQSDDDDEQPMISGRILKIPFNILVDFNPDLGATNHYCETLRRLAGMFGETSVIAAIPTTFTGRATTWFASHTMDRNKM